jgi:Ca2+/Na+ antiporter
MNFFENLSIGVPIAVFIFLFIILIFASISLAYLIEAFQKKTNLGGGFASGIILSGITSLPELCIGLTMFFTGHPENAVGDLTGGIFLDSVILAVMFLAVIKMIQQHNCSRVHLLTYGSLSVMLLMYMIATLVGQEFSVFTVSFISVAGVIIYGLNAWYCAKHKFYYTPSEQYFIDTNTKSHVNNNFFQKFLGHFHNVKKVRYLVLELVGFALVILICSFFISFAAETIIDDTVGGSASTTFIASIILSVVTSSTEIISMVILLKLKDINNALSDIGGAALFNTLILSLLEIMYIGDPVYADSKSRLLMIFSFAGVFVVFLCLLI